MLLWLFYRFIVGNEHSNWITTYTFNHQHSRSLVDLLFLKQPFLFRTDSCWFGFFFITAILQALLLHPHPQTIMHLLYDSSQIRSRESLSQLSQPWKGRSLSPLNPKILWDRGKNHHRSCLQNSPEWDMSLPLSPFSLEAVRHDLSKFNVRKDFPLKKESLLTQNPSIIPLNSFLRPQKWPEDNLLYL